MPKQSDGPAPLTAKEKAAIRTLERLAETWPRSLWLFSGSGTFCVMKTNAEGERAMHPGESGSVDQAFIVATVDIENDGGDW